MPVQYGTKHFREQLSFFKDKLNLPTRSWTDLWEGMHARAFVVAGAMKDELLVDLNNAVRKAIEKGTTLAEFRQDFDAIVGKHGWGYKGGRNWRTRVIYETNLRTSYQAGRYKQMKALVHRRPYWQYKHSNFVKDPRKAHLEWNGLVLKHDDDWWDTHYPPNGWGCRCTVRTLAERDLKKLGKAEPDNAPPIEWKTHEVGKRGPKPRKVEVPKGIDPGWGYNVGQAAYGKQLAKDVMAEWEATKDAWVMLNKEGWAEAGRPARIPLVKPPVPLGKRLTNRADVVDALTLQLGGESKVYRPGGLPVEVHAGVLGGHIDPARAEYLPLLDDLLTNPYEIWLAFEQHKGTGKVRLRARFIKGYDLGRGKVLLFVGNASRGILEGWTFIPSSKLSQMNRRRKGWLIYKDGGDE
jgi:hypothetical protein